MFVRSSIIFAIIMITSDDDKFDGVSDFNVVKLPVTVAESVVKKIH